MLKNLLALLILLAGFPTAVLLSNICKDEIKNWRAKLLIISIICFFLIIALFFSDYSYKIPIIIALLFIIITELTVVWRNIK